MKTLQHLSRFNIPQRTSWISTTCQDLMKGGGYDASSKNNNEALPAGLNLGKDSRTCMKYVCLQFCVCYWGHLPCSKGILLPCCQAPCEPHLVIANEEDFIKNVYSPTCHQITRWCKGTCHYPSCWHGNSMLLIGSECIPDNYFTIL